MARNRKNESAIDSDDESTTPTEETANPRDDRPIDERIRARAYELFLERRGESGNDVDDWLRAEREFGERQ